LGEGGRQGKRWETLGRRRKTGEKRYGKRGGDRREVRGLVRTRENGEKRGDGD
jgi:hypothetical protein